MEIESKTSSIYICKTNNILEEPWDYFLSDTVTRTVTPLLQISSQEENREDCDCLRCNPRAVASISKRLSSGAKWEDGMEIEWWRKKYEEKLGKRSDENRIGSTCAGINLKKPNAKMTAGSLSLFLGLFIERKKMPLSQHYLLLLICRLMRHWESE